VSDQLTEEKIELQTNAGYSKNSIELYANKVNIGAIENADGALPYTGPCSDTCFNNLV